MNPIAVAFRLTRATYPMLWLVIGMLFGYAALLTTSRATCDDDVISRVELLE